MPGHNHHGWHHDDHHGWHRDDTTSTEQAESTTPAPGMGEDTDFRFPDAPCIHEGQSIDCECHGSCSSCAAWFGSYEGKVDKCISCPAGFTFCPNQHAYHRHTGNIRTEEDLQGGTLEVLRNITYSVKEGQYDLVSPIGRCLKAAEGEPALDDLCNRRVSYHNPDGMELGSWKFVLLMAALTALFIVGLVFKYYRARQALVAALREAVITNQPQLVLACSTQVPALVHPDGQITAVDGMTLGGRIDLASAGIVVDGSQGDGDLLPGSVPEDSKIVIFHSDELGEDQLVGIAVADIPRTPPKLSSPKDHINDLD